MKIKKKHKGVGYLAAGGSNNMLEKHHDTNKDQLKRRYLHNLQCHDQKIKRLLDHGFPVSEGLLDKYCKVTTFNFNSPMNGLNFFVLSLKEQLLLD